MRKIPFTKLDWQHIQKVMTDKAASNGLHVYARKGLQMKGAATNLVNVACRIQEEVNQKSMGSAHYEDGKLRTPVKTILDTKNVGKTHYSPALHQRALQLSSFKPPAQPQAQARGVGMVAPARAARASPTLSAHTRQPRPSTTPPLSVRARRASHLTSGLPTPTMRLGHGAAATSGAAPSSTAGASRSTQSCGAAQSSPHLVHEQARAPPSQQAVSPSPPPVAQQMASLGTAQQGGSLAPSRNETTEQEDTQRGMSHGAGATAGAKHEHAAKGVVGAQRDVGGADGAAEGGADGGEYHGGENGPFGDGEQKEQAQVPGGRKKQRQEGSVELRGQGGSMRSAYLGEWSVLEQAGVVPRGDAAPTHVPPPELLSEEVPEDKEVEEQQIEAQYAEYELEEENGDGAS
ncbi:hypothetical protein DUNSADRAFT_642 [Dunaliella salina]|uniref:Uncharacterized protein n=1 Tax=Dunaliella salina TaxID=3046 RepID=A0ABQ7FYL3_DUNSA|nr:hypothetical protein DUNSADRAFT_642 [Dunaliella salina]|eukprot:KAF5827445.1 hypothetical protein DUNSADRAFT_642 [Dunaliella salina]